MKTLQLELSRTGSAVLPTNNPERPVVAIVPSAMILALSFSATWLATITRNGHQVVGVDEIYVVID